jgi:CubicO group peptidase (beta-lactamase class C family)
MIRQIEGCEMTVSRRTWLKMAALTAGTAGAGAASAQAQRPPVVATVTSVGKTDYSAVIEELRRYIERHLDEYGLPGMTGGLADGEGFTAVITAGWANIDRAEPVRPEHLFQIGSISKSMTALCAYRLADAGRLDLDARVDRLMPELPLPSTPFTVAQLLDHTTGLPDDAPFFPRGGDQRLWLGYAPGSKMSYSNTGYGIIGMILEKVEQRPYPEIVVRQVFEPLGMAGARSQLAVIDRPEYAVGYHPYFTDRPFPRRGRLGEAPWVDFAEASGSIGASAPMMTRYVRYLIDAGAGKGAPLFSDALAKRYVTATTDAPIFGPKARYASGLAVVQVDGRPLLHHTGGMVAFSSSIHVDAAEGVGGFASTNVMIGDYRPRAITAYACMLMRGARQGKPAAAAPAVTPAEAVEKAADYAGRYRSASGDAIELRANGDRLMLGFDGGEAVMQSAGPDQFLALHRKYSLHPFGAERENGKVVRIWWGDLAYASDPARLPPPAPKALDAFTGRYDNDSPWLGTFRVVARGGKLWVDGAGPLEPQAEGYYSFPGSDTERVWFDAVVDSKAQRLIFSGTDFVRRPDAA